MLAAIVLAAGESKRMGFPKALLPYPGVEGRDTTFLEHLLEVFARSKAEPILAVLGHEAERIEKAVAWGRARPVVNARYREGMLSSLQAGLHALDENTVLGALVVPVDHPDIGPEIVDRLISTFDETRRVIVLPVYQGRRGHPVLFSREVFDEIRRAPETVGARQVVWDHEKDLLEVEVSDPGIARDVDTPGDYRTFREDRS